MKVCFRYEHLQQTARARPSGYLDEVLRVGRREGADVCMSEEDYRALCARFSPGQIVSSAPAIFGTRPEPLNWFEAMREFVEELRRWSKAGFVIAPREKRAGRQKICDQCEHWRPHAYGLLGDCELCRCTKAKTFLLTSQCPDVPPRW